MLARSLKIASVLLAAFDFGIAATTPSPSWKQLAPIADGPRQEHATVAIKNKIYVIGGIIYNDTTLTNIETTNRVSVYDIASDKWSVAPPMPVAMNHVNAAGVGDKLYILGGLSDGTKSNGDWLAIGDCAVLDTRKGTWKVLPPMPAGSERGSSAMGVWGDWIYLAGGMTILQPQENGRQGSVATVSAYNTNTGKWKCLPDLPAPRDHSGGAVIGNKFWQVGGRDHGIENVRGTAWSLDLTRRKATWIAHQQMPTARGGICAAAIDNKIYTFGGEGDLSNANKVFPEVEAIDVRTGRWERLPNMPRPVHGTSAAAVGGRIYIPGGGAITGGGKLLDINQLFTPRY